MHAEIPLSILLVIALLTGVVATPSGKVDAPRLTVGDSWTYHTNTSLGPAFFFDGHVTLTVTGMGPVTVEGATYDAVRTSVSGAGTATGTVSTPVGPTPASGTWLLAGQEVLESAGLKVVSSVLDLEANGTLHTQPVAIQFKLTIQNSTTYRLEDDAWRFPLVIGNSTLVGSQMNFSEDIRLSYGSPVQARGRAWWNVTYSLETQIAVDTPAGRFDAYRIRELDPDGSYSLVFYAPATGNNARTETFSRTSEVATSELVSYRYQALEPARFLGLPLDDWAIAGVIGAAAGSVAAWWWVRRKRPPVPPSMGLQPPST